MINTFNNTEEMQDFVTCGFLKCTCEKQPRITYINRKMIEILRFPEAKDGETDYLEMYKSNIFLMIPMEERRRFSKYLNGVYSADGPVAGDMTLLRCDGSKVRVFGWVSKCINEHGEAEFQCACMDVTERYRSRKEKESRRYIDALTDVYDKIFEINCAANTVKCLHCEASSDYRRFVNVAMQIEDALDTWLLSSVSEEHREEIRKFFTDFTQNKLSGSAGKPPQISYLALSSDGRIKKYTGVVIKIDDSVSLYCCRENRDADYSKALKLENTLLKEKMRDLVMQFSDGLAAFEISPEGMVKPLYASDNVCEFFGYTKDEWLPLTERFTPLDSFVAYSDASYDEFVDLLKTGEAEFSYFDYQSESEKRIKAICSEKEPNGRTSRYVMLYDVDGEASDERDVFVRTFGYFDVFVGDNPIAFRNKKSKELFALLVDRKGGYVTSEEAIGFLWEDEPVNTLTLSRYRKVALRLKNTLEEYGIPEVVEA
ncbi:MAG: hypothetical protein K6E56_05255, partial [Lachnospiraceae bacterium]|nr:hypothetical protein [Lachnospiraceae bacterium]